MPESKLNGFDAVAGIYDGLACLVYGNRIQAAQLHFLNVIPPDATVLMMGGGTGWLLRELLARHSGCTVWYVEASAKMVALARDKVGDDARVRFIHGTEEAVPDDVAFDVVVTNFFLDLFALPKLELVVQRLKKTLRSEGYWLATDFVDGGKFWQTGLLRLMFFFFRMTAGIESRELADWDRMLSSCGLRSERVRLFYGGFIRTAVYRVVDSGKTTCV